MRIEEVERAVNLRAANETADVSLSIWKESYIYQGMHGFIPDYDIWIVEAVNGVVARDFLGKKLSEVKGL